LFLGIGVRLHSPSGENLGSERRKRRGEREKRKRKSGRRREFACSPREGLNHSGLRSHPHSPVLQGQLHIPEVRTLNPVGILLQPGVVPHSAARGRYLPFHRPPWPGERAAQSRGWGRQGPAERACPLCPCALIRRLLLGDWFLMQQCNTRRKLSKNFQPNS
jgi:hypothetical protein